MKEVYQLHAKGQLKFLDGTGRAVSKKVFTTRGGAEAHTPKFLDKCTTPKSDEDLACLKNDDHLKISIHALELVDE